jgi:SpoVK/Ycf46/Vps4 family AAA+-type ATPase
MPFSSELVHHLRALTRAIYVVTDEEDTFIQDFRRQMPKYTERTFVFNRAFGMLKIDDLVNDWQNRTHTREGSDIPAALKRIYTDDPRENEHFYIITDPDVILDDEFAVRQVLNIIHQLHNDSQIVKCLIFVGSSRFIPPKLSRYIEVVELHGLDQEELLKTVTDSCANFKMDPPADYASLFRGFTSYEIDQVITQAMVSVMADPHASKRIDPNFVSEYRRKQIRKTDLVQIINTQKFTFKSVGGVERFKEWASATKSCWTPEGRKFGLRVPRGVLLMGVYGCGKSLSAKALASEWELPLVQLELGRLRNPAVGRSENNLIQALRIIETVAPCAVWIDEAEKSLAGGASSAQSDAGTTSRMLGILSTWAQELESPVSLILTANSLRNLPPEMVNRLPDRFFFDVPDESSVIEILKIHAGEFNQDISGFQLNELAKAANQLVGREIEQCVESAMTSSFNAKKPALDEEILHHELRAKSRIITTMKDEIAELTEWVGYDPETDDGVKAKLAAPKRRGKSFKVVGTAARV